MNRVEVGFFSLNGASPDVDDETYFRWHQLDHMPEQYRLPGIQHGQRWSTTPASLAARAFATPELAATRHLTLYLMGRPVRSTLEDFVALDGQLTADGRFPQRLPPVHLAPYRLLATAAAPHARVSPEVVPWRPNCGAYLLVEDVDREPRDEAEEWTRRVPATEVPDLLAAPGVAGAWTFRPPEPGLWTASDPLHALVTVLYLDADPATTAASLQPALEARWERVPVRPLFAGPVATRHVLSAGPRD